MNQNSQLSVIVHKVIVGQFSFYRFVPYRENAGGTEAVWIYCSFIPGDRTSIAMEQCGRNDYGTPVEDFKDNLTHDGVELFKKYVRNMFKGRYKSYMDKHIEQTINDCVVEHVAFNQAIHEVYRWIGSQVNELGAVVDIGGFNEHVKDYVRTLSLRN